MKLEQQIQFVLADTKTATLVLELIKRFIDHNLTDIAPRIHKSIEEDHTP